MKIDDTPDNPEPTGPGRPTYLDFNATTPVDPRVADEVLRYMTAEFGNAGSRTHSYGQAAKVRVLQAREEVATLLGAKPDEIIFTSGATESNNLAILGLASYGNQTGRKHIISSQIEHKSVLEPLERLTERGFDVTLLPPTRGGWITPESVAATLRDDTLLVSIMAVNNETGVIQPTDEIASAMEKHDAFYHLDGAQAFGKLIAPLANPRIDLISISGHKIHAPKGIGALMTRRRAYRRPPLEPLLYGGGQERGLRPGTLPVSLIAGLGAAAAIASTEHSRRWEEALVTKQRILDALAPFGALQNGDPERTLPTTLNVSLASIDSEAAIVALKDLMAISNGSACTSQRYIPSHVLLAAGLPKEQVEGALRISWGGTRIDLDKAEIQQRLSTLQPNLPHDEHSEDT